MKKLFSLAIVAFMSFGLTELEAGDRYDFEWEVDDNSEIQPFMLSYNRVEGLFFGFGIPKEFKDAYGMPSRLTFYGSLGYGISNDEKRYRAGLSKRFFGLNSLEFGTDIFSLTNTDAKNAD